MTAHAPIPYDILTARLKALAGIRLDENEPLAGHITMGVGGPARWLAQAESPEALEGLLALLRESGWPWMMLGGGSNTVFTDAGFPGVVVTLGREFRRIAEGPGPGQLTAGAAASLSSVTNAAKRAGLTGLEWAAGVPGTLGGALAGNAGTAAGDICSLAEAVDVIDAAGRRLTRRRGAFDFGYRTSALAGDTILRAALALTPGDPVEIQQRTEQALGKRWTQPVGLRCSGCAFKNPPGDHAGRLIDQAGLKGLRVGGAYVSPEHANFIINDGTATAGDIQALTARIREEIRRRHGIELESEIRMVGLDPPSALD
jgi:UDP-N-acetylmuramate dehydrogenase